MSSNQRHVGTTTYLMALFDWRTWVVFRRNAKVHLRNWKTAFLPPALEPVIFFVAFGIGLGAYVGTMPYAGENVSYVNYVAPGMLAYTAFTSPFFEALYGSYVRMFYQKTWDGILATQVELEHIVWGEITWAGARGAMNTSAVALVLIIFDAIGAIDISLGWLLVVPPMAFLLGWAFGAFALIFTAIVPNIDHMNYPVFLIGIPLSLVSNTYFPIETSSPAINAVLGANPIYRMAEGSRGMLLTGELTSHFFWLLVSGIVMLAVCTVVAQRLIRRRVLGER